MLGLIEGLGAAARKQSIDAGPFYARTGGPMSAENTTLGETQSATPITAPVTALQTEVMTAVRGAISTVMAGQGKGLDLAGIDLDFSRAANASKLPVLLAKPEQALAIPMASPAPKAPSASRYAIAATVTVTLALSGAAAAAWLQGLPEASERSYPVVTASLDAMPMPVSTKAIQAPVPAPALEPEPILAPVETTAATPAAPLETDIAIRARGLLESGQVREARALLLSAPDTESVDVAWILARSFDGNYLQTLGKADMTANSVEARRWYERWFDRAKKKGVVDKTVRLDRLLLSLK